MARYERIPTSQPPSECSSEDEELWEKEAARNSSPIDPDARDTRLAGDKDNVDAEADQPSPRKKAKRERLLVPNTRLGRILFVTAIFLPCLSGMAVSWIPFLWLSVKNPPPPLFWNALSSCLELLVVTLLFCWVHYLRWQNAVNMRAGNPPATDIMFRIPFTIGLGFAMFNPIAMGVYMFCSIFMHPCYEGDTKDIQCGISSTLFCTIVWFRITLQPTMYVSIHYLGSVLASMLTLLQAADVFLPVQGIQFRC
ncbi:hypothetical protein ACJZ2D_012740 [Fusarium nematophilum]